MDNLTRKQRRKNMQKIRSKDTKIELLLARELRKQKIYFSRNVKSILGKPDFVFRKKKTAVFVDSDFWHGHPSRYIKPKTNTAYWKAKIERNIKRDKKVTSILKSDGWKVVRLWEKDIKSNMEKGVNKILKEL